MNQCDQVSNRHGRAAEGRSVPLGLARQGLCLLAAILALMLAAQFASAATISFDFNNGLQGWTALTSTTRGAWNSGGNAWGATGSGSIYGYDGDDGADNTYWVRSPVFQLDGSGSLTVRLWGGKANAAAPANDASVPSYALSGAGFKGVALREVATGNYVASLSLGGNGANSNCVLTATDLAPYANNGKMYTLDFLDYDYGGWGWVGLDNVSIPGVLMVTKTAPAFQALTIGSNATVSVSIPTGFNASSAVTVYLTNGNPALLLVNGSTAPVTTLVFAQGASVTQTVTVTGAGLGVAQLTTGSAALTSATAAVAVLSPSGLIGRWLTGAQDLLDKSGYTPAGTHDGLMSGGFPALFSTDVPAGASVGASSLDLASSGGAVLITNTTVTDGAYLPTFDDGTAQGLSVVFWAKGLPGNWNPFVSKYGEGSTGWQVRKRSDQPVGTFTVRSTGGEDDPYTGSTLLDDGNWHHFAATFDGVGGVRRLYVDGKLNNLVPQDFGPMGLANTSYLTLGGRSGGGSSTPGNLFAGLLYDVQIYGVALSGSAVQALFAPQASALVAYADDPIVDTNRTGTVSVSIPAGANASSAVTVYVTNTTPTIASLAGAVANVATLTFPVGGATSQKLSVTGLAEGTAQFACAATGLTGASFAVRVYGPHLIGLWFNGLENYADSSGFALSGTHDGVEVGTTGTLTFSTDTPPSKTGKAAQFGGAVGLMITNTSLSDGAYAATFDNLTANRQSVAFWAKGLPGNWNPFLSKRGEDGIGWQVRRQGSTYNADYTIRGTPGSDDPQGAIAINDGQWHHFAAVWDGIAGIRKLFVDGTLDTNINLTGDSGPMLYAPNHHLVLGARERYVVTNTQIESAFSGLLYDVRVYNYGLSLVEVSNLSFVAALKLNPAQRSLQAPLTMTVDVILPSGANQAKAITVTVSNQTPALVSLVGASNNIVTLTYPIGGSLTQQVAVAGIADGKATLKATGGGFAVGLTTFNVWSDPGRKLIGHWLTGAANLAESSGFRAAGKHDGVAVGSSAGLLAFSADVPWVAAAGSQSLDLSAGNVAVAITNSATTDGDYVETFDGQMMNKFSITFWAKGAFTADWNPWVSKRGENNVGYQVRRHGGDYPVKPCFTIRGTPGDDDPYANTTVDDLSWHHYAATWDGTAGLRDIYVDGIRYGLTSGNDVGPMALATGDHFTIGARDNGGFGNFFPGYFFDVRVYSYALSAAEVAVMVNPPTVLGISLARTNIALGSVAQLEVTVPATATATSPLTVYLTNNSPSVVTIVGSTGNVFPVTFPVGSVVQLVDLRAIGLGQVDISVGVASLGSASLTTVNLVFAPKLIGHWFSGAASLADTSGYMPAGTHDGFAIGTNAVALAFNNDVPPGYRGQSLDLRATNVAVMITNSANVDGGYLPTFDEAISANFTIAFWAKGFPTSDWNPWVSKQGEGGAGWQLRRLGNNTTAGFTIRGIDSEDGWGSNINVNDTPAKWHHFAGVWDQLTGMRTLYIDGVLSATVLNNPAQTISLAQTKHLVLGAREGSPDAITGDPYSFFFPGLLYDVRVYNYPMGAADVAALAILPTIKITPSGSQLRIAWPASMTGYTIEQSSTVTSGWGAAGLTVSVEGAENAAYAPTTNSVRFFRLKK